MLSNRMFRCLTFFLLLAQALPALADNFIEDKQHPRFAIKVAPFEYYIGSFNTEFEVWLGPNFSLIMPVFYANHDTALIKDALFWNSSLGVNFGLKVHLPNGPLAGFYAAPETGVFVVYPFEGAREHVLVRGPSGKIYASETTSPFAMPVGVFRVGYEWVFDSGFMVDLSAGLTMYGSFPRPMTRLQAGWAF